MTTADTPAAPAKKKQAGTRYIVLEQRPSGGPSWVEIADVKDASAEGAIRQAFAGDTTGGTFVAVPARSWRPVLVSLETVSRVKLEAAS